MSDKVKIALIAAVTSIILMCLYLYNSPYRTCVRASQSLPDAAPLKRPGVAEMYCATNQRTPF